MQCIHIKTNGQQCRAYSMLDSQYCWLHSPDVNKYEKKLALSRGGINRHKLEDIQLPEMLIQTSKDIPAVIVDTIQRLRNRTIDVRRGAVIGYLSNILLRSYEATDIEDRIHALEELVRTGEYEFNTEKTNENDK